MTAAPSLWVGPFHLDPANECLWRGTEALRLTHKAFAALHYLAQHPGRVVTKEELFQAIWPAVVVSDAALTTCLREIRKALEDDPQTPRYIETVHRRGYRFIAPLTTSQPVSSSKFQVSGSHSALRTLHSALGLVGREVELEQLHSWLEKALNGERQIVFVTGEPGIGKTTLVEAFLEQVAARGGLWIGRGQCIEHYGAGEAYLPVLEALGRLCREPGGERLIELLSQHAPTWLVQMPALLNAAELDALQRKTQGATRERMLRELAEAVEALTAKQPLVLWLEDLHWSDYSTLEWLAFVARRREAARLLVLGAYRPVEAILSGHPLQGVKQELQLYGHCEELPLGLLSEAAVGEYLAVRFPAGMGAHVPLQQLAKLIHRRTDGNPLFMVNVVEYLVSHGVLVQVEGQWALQGGVEEVAAVVPESLRQMIERQTERLSPMERRVLAVASVAGAEFSAAAVAAGIGVELGEVEERCEELVRREQFLRARGVSEWPDGTVAARYEFIHALYQNIVYERVTAGRRQRWHQQIGEREEVAYGNRSGEIAAELAVHFERGRDYRRAVQYLEHAGQNALRRSAPHEAISHLTKGLELLKALPATPECIQQELALQMSLGLALMTTKGYAAPEAEAAYARARELCQQVEETPQLFFVLLGLITSYAIQPKLQIARELAERCLTMAQSSQDPALLLEAHLALGQTLLPLGELALARMHLEQGLALYDPRQHHSHTFLYGHDPGVFCLIHMALVLWYMGYPEQAIKRSHEALSLAQELAHPFTLAAVLSVTAVFYQFQRERHAMQARIEAAQKISTKHGFTLYVTLGTFLQGWALAEQGQMEEGIAQMRRSLAASWATGTERFRPYQLALLAEAQGKGGRAEEGLSVLAEALAMMEKNEEREHEAELYRLKGELLLNAERRTRKDERNTKKKGRASSPIHHSSFIVHRSAEAEAEACFLKAIAIARRQEAKSWELRAVMSLSRLWQQQGKTAEAQQMLAEIYGWFTEGFDTADLKEAKALLAELA